LSTILVCLFFVLLLRVSREQICHAAFFLECLYRARPLGGPGSLKCLPDSLNVYCANALGYSFVLFFYGRHRCSSGRCFFVASFQDCCSCLIQLCKVEVLFKAGLLSSLVDCSCRSSLSVLLIYVPGNHASSYADNDVHSCLENCNAKGFSKNSCRRRESFYSVGRKTAPTCCVSAQ
jgi:hypothetical protein